MSRTATTPVWRTARTLAILFWSGFACAPLAALVLMLSERPGLIKFALVLGMATVVLIGLSVVLRRDAESVERELNEAVAESERHTFQLLAEMRGEIRQLSRALESAPNAAELTAGAEDYSERPRRRSTPPRGNEVESARYGSGVIEGDYDYAAAEGAAPAGRGASRGHAPGRHYDAEPSPNGAGPRPSPEEPVERRREPDHRAPRQRGGAAEYADYADYDPAPRHGGYEGYEGYGEAASANRRHAEPTWRTEERSVEVRMRHSRSGPADGWGEADHNVEPSATAWSEDFTSRRPRRHDDDRYGTPRDVDAGRAIADRESDPQPRWSDYDRPAPRRGNSGSTYMDEYYGDREPRRRR